MGIVTAVVVVVSMSKPRERERERDARRRRLSLAIYVVDRLGIVSVPRWVAGFNIARDAGWSGILLAKTRGLISLRARMSRVACRARACRVTTLLEQNFSRAETLARNAACLDDGARRFCGGDRADDVALGNVRAPRAWPHAVVAGANLIIRDDDTSRRHTARRLWRSRHKNTVADRQKNNS